MSRGDQIDLALAIATALMAVGTHYLA